MVLASKKSDKTLTIVSITLCILFWLCVFLIFPDFSSGYIQALTFQLSEFDRDGVPSLLIFLPCLLLLAGPFILLKVGLERLKSEVFDSFKEE